MNLIDENRDKFSLYYDFLVSENEKYNLTAITEKKEVYIKHFLDSILMDKVVDLNEKIKICYPNIDVTIIEPTKKRVNFLTMLCDKLDIKVNIINARAEDVATELEENYDIVTARAVANTNVLLELLTKLCKVKGKLVLYKGEKAREEIDNAKNAINLLKLKVESINDFELDEGYGFRSLVVIGKLEKTSSKYPRRYAEILRKPL